MGQETVKHHIVPTLVGFFLSAILLTVIHPPLNLSLLAWIAWVPFVLACRDTISTGKLLLCAYLGGLCFWFGNLYWLVIVTTPGYIAFSFVQALYWPLLVLSVRYVRRKKWPLALAAPVIFVGAEAIQGYLFTGFSWYYLAHSQYQHLSLIQISDIFGALGVSVLIAMVNGFVAQAILDWKINRPVRKTTLAYGSLIAVLLTLTIVYGNYRLNESPDHQTDSPLLGSVQPNVPAWVKEEMSSGQKLLDDLIADSEHCIRAGAEMVCWPETMILAPMNPQYLSLCQSNSDPSRYHQQITKYANDNGYILFGAHTATIGIRESSYAITNQYNSAFLYRPDGTVAPKIYHKIHLVPFGEYIPFKKSAPWIYKMILWLSPYDYDYNLTAGTDYTTFEIDTENGPYRFAVLICYEDTDPTVTRKHVLADDGTKKTDWLVNLSNDGWYVHFKERQVIPMVELAQRTAISVFRCVENRISIIRSVNTGISCAIEPTGKIRNDFQAGNLPENAMQRQGVDGWFVDTVPIDSRITSFSRYGRWLDRSLIVFFVALFALAVYDRPRNKPKAGD